ncbi:hypothetical protein C8259_08210 [Nocardia nova]|uniref:Cold shock domain-containing protein n=1 Tax=Nocardia nova TaxID=37330 RepID=A0A2T2ZB41_9NOCA|nr:hypothetical protein C8259_08210 [Nocardia nova]
MRSRNSPLPAPARHFEPRFAERSPQEHFADTVVGIIEYVEIEREVQHARGRVWRWNDKRATGIIETEDGSHVWFGLDSLGEHKDFGDVALDDSVEVEYEAAQQDSHDLRAIKVTWP